MTVEWTGRPSNIQRLAQQVRESFMDGVPDVFCAQCRTELPVFVSDELAGRPVDAQHSDMAHHLDVCSACLGEYEALAKLMVNALHNEDRL